VSSETNDKGVAFANIALAQSEREIRVFANNLKLKSEIEHSGQGTASSAAMLLDKTKVSSYRAGDLIGYNHNKNVGYVL